VVELKRRNLEDVGHSLLGFGDDHALLEGEIETSPLGGPRAVEVYLVRDGHHTCAGRVLVPRWGRRPDVLEFLAPWIAEVLARAVVSPATAALDTPCG
jgi:hypothetical protein